MLKSYQTNNAKDARVEGVSARVGIGGGLGDH